MFTGETLVSIEEGLGPIEDIQVGDYVWSEDIETGEQSLKKVLNVIVSETDVVVYIVTEENEITTTQNHPFYVEGKGWTPASELEEGDVLHTKEGVTTVVQSIEVEQLDQAVKVYNLEVENGHTYYVTGERVLVHNDCGNKGKDGRGNKIFQDDFSLDIKDTYIDLLKHQLSDEEAEKIILNNFMPTEEEILDDNTSLFWLAFAAVKWEVGRLDKIRNRRQSRLLIMKAVWNYGRRILKN
jgi:hypothetical protein